MLKKDLTDGDVGNHLYDMTVPMIWGILSIMSMNIVDTFYVGQLGTEPLAAMSFTIPIVSILLSLAFGVGIGASSVIARALGAQQHDMVQSYATHSIIIALFIAVAFALLGYHYMDPIFRALGAPAHLFPLIHDFMDIWFLGSFVVVVPMVGNSALRASGNTRVPGLIMMSVAVVNIILDPLLIFGMFGLPRMELAGAALATVISYSIALVIGLYFLTYKLGFVRFSACTRNIAASWKAILRISIPATGTNLIAPLSVAITTWLVSGYGPEAVAGFGVASRIESICIVVVMALSSIMGPFVGQNWGANRKDRVAEALRISFRFITRWNLAVAALLLVAGHSLASLFSDNPLVIDSARWYLWLVPISYMFLGFIMTSSSAANGTGDPRPSLVMSFMRLLGLYLPLVFVLNQLFGLIGLYLASTLANILVGLGAWHWSRKHLKPEA